MTTWKTVTVASGGGDYTNLDAVDAGEAIDLAAQNLGDLVVSCEDFSDTTAVNFGSGAWNTNTSNRLIIQAADDHTGKWSTSTYRLEILNASALTFSATGLNDVLLQGIQVRDHGTGGGTRCIRIQSTVGTGIYELDKVIVINERSGTSGSPHGIENSNNGTTIKLRNVIAYGDRTNQANSRGFNGASSTANAFIYNCVFDDWDVGIQTGSQEDVRCKNTRITAVGTVKSGTANLHNGSNFNLTDNTAPTNWGVDSIDSGDAPTISYVDDSNATHTSRDYHLSAASDSGHEAGTDLSGDANNPISDDIDGTARTVPWDIGVHELSAGATIIASVKRSINNKGLNAAQIRGAFF